MTETSRQCCTRPRGCRAQGRLVRKPVLHTEVRIVRPDGTDADVGELGELWVKGPNVTPGYWNRPRPTVILHRWLAAHRRRHARR
jgi:acyl-CoA synthetase (AMP-forming)/AMP-acid ligase II